MYIFCSFVTESEVVAHDQTESSSDEECSRSRSVRRPRTAAVGHVVEAVGSSGHRNKRKRRRHQKILLSPTPLSSDSRSGGGSSLSSKNARDERENKLQATHALGYGSLEVGSEFRNIRKQTPPSTYHGSTNADALHTNTSPDPAQEKSITKAASPVQLPSLTSQCRKDLLRGGSSCTPVPSDDIKRKRHKSAHCMVEGHTMTASSHEETRTDAFECGTCMRTEGDGMLEGNSGGKEEEEKTQNASVQTSPISSRKPHRIPRRRRLRWACVHRGQSLPWSTPPRKFRQRHKHNVSREGEECQLKLEKPLHCGYIQSVVCRRSYPVTSRLNWKCINLYRLASSYGGRLHLLV